MRYGRIDTIFNMLERDELRDEFKIQAIIDGFIISIEQDEYLTAIKLWKDYQIVILTYHEGVVKALI